jgi:hypothetical protein
VDAEKFAFRAKVDRHRMQNLAWLARIMAPFAVPYIPVKQCWHQRMPNDATAPMMLTAFGYGAMSDPPKLLHISA